MEDDPGFSDDGRDLCRYRCESQTYEALCSRGVCGSGFVPLFYGTYENLDPELFGNSLDSFKNDRRRPSAILTQYLPGATSLTAKNVTPGLLQQAIEGLKAIHSAWVIHNDAEPKNALVVSNRIVWVDFDVSIVFFGEKRGDLILADEIESEVEFFCSCAHKLVSTLIPRSTSTDNWLDTEGGNHTFDDRRLEDLYHKLLLV
jgi:serine/threonine protein kinase